MLEKLKILLASRWLPYIISGLFAIAMVILWRITKESPLPTIPAEVVQREAEAKAEAKYAKQHEENEAKHEAAAKTHEARESQLSSNITRLKRELDALRPNTGHVGGGESGDAGGSGDASVDGPAIAKLQEIVAEQGTLITELTSETNELKAALVDSKMATAAYKEVADKRLQDVAALQAVVSKATSEAKSEITKAEWRGGFKGTALGVLTGLLVRR